MGKNVLIVGASGDIGVAIAKQLAEQNYQLILHYNHNKQALEAFRKSIEPEKILFMLQADLSNATACKAFVKQLVFPIDAVVFASGKAHFGLFQDTPEDVMDEMLQLHIKSPWMIVKELLPSMIHTGGQVIFITSIWGEQGASNEVIYSSVKGAQNSFVKALAKEVGPSGVSVNAISPGYIETKMNQHLLDEEKAEIIADIPLNRAGKPEEIAHMTSFLLSGNSSYIQGEIINVTGGW
ncbi:MAG: elongation factor P 5-aminopentanone reductase [Bacillota bacterium]